MSKTVTGTECSQMEIDEVSVVNRGASQEAHVLLFKGDGGESCTPEEKKRKKKYGVRVKKVLRPSHTISTSEVATPASVRAQQQ